MSSTHSRYQRWAPLLHHKKWISGTATITTENTIWACTKTQNNVEYVHNLVTGVQKTYKWHDGLLLSQVGLWFAPNFKSQNQPVILSNEWLHHD